MSDSRRNTQGQSSSLRIFSRSPAGIIWRVGVEQRIPTIGRSTYMFCNARLQDGMVARELH